MKPKKINVFYDDLLVGELRDFGDQTGFAYAPSFLASSHQLSPLQLPLESRVFVSSDPGMAYLPGIFCDSLPDRYGRKIMRDWYAKHMGADYIISAADMLAYVGKNGMGALRYEPAKEEFDAEALRELDLEKARREAKDYLDGKGADVLESLRSTAKTVGGTFPKALVSVDPANGRTYESRAGLPPHLEHWIVKFGIGDARGSDLSNYPEVELAYMDMARDSGIDVPECRAFETEHEGKKLVHFGIRRFDLIGDRRIHYASLSGLKGMPADDDYWDYRHLLEVTEQVAPDHRAIKEQCRRMIFNVATANWDDHAKNHGFLYDGKSWSVAPAFDLGYFGHVARGAHSLAIAGRIRDVEYAALEKLSCKAGLKKQEVREIADRIRDVLSQATSYLEKRGVSKNHRETIEKGIAGVAAPALAVVP